MIAIKTLVSLLCLRATFGSAQSSSSLDLSPETLLAMLQVEAPANGSLVKRTNCNPTCPSDYRPIAYSMPDCAWNCLVWSGEPLEFSASWVRPIAKAISGVVGFAGLRSTDTHWGYLHSKRELSNVTADAFDLAVGDIFGGTNRKRDEVQRNGDEIGTTLHSVDRKALFANGTVDGIYAELKVTPEHVVVYLGNSYSPQWIEPTSNNLTKRSAVFTNAAIVYHNALVGGQPQVRQFTLSDRGRIGLIVSAFYSVVCQTLGRSMCNCLRSGQGNEFAGALTIMGQMNNNGMFQFMRCDCDTNPW